MYFIIFIYNSIILLSGYNEDDKNKKMPVIHQTDLFHQHEFLENQIVFTGRIIL